MAVVIGDMDATVTAHRQRLFHRLLDPVATDAEYGQVTIAKLLLELHRLLDGVLVVFVHPPGEIGVVVPVAFGVDLELRFHVRNLFDADQ